MKEKAEEIELASEQHDSKRLYSSLKALYGSQSSGSCPLLSSDGSKLLADKQEIRDRWAEHSDAVLNRPSTISDSAINKLPQVKVNESLDSQQLQK